MNDHHEARDFIRLYFDDVSSTRPLSREREAELAARVQEGDSDARDEFVQANLLFVVSVARQYQNCGLPLSDLIGAGNLGLMIAVDRFDGHKGYKFISYAVHWIRQSIRMAIAEQPRVVRLPMNYINLMQQIVDVKERLRQAQGREPDTVEIATALEVSVEHVREVLLHEERIRSLDTELGEDGDGRSLLNFIPDPQQKPPDAEVERASDQACWERVLSILSGRERHIICLYFGFDGEEPKTLEEIGHILGLTRERVRQIKENALRKLTHGSRAKDLSALIEEERGDNYSWKEY